MTRRLRRGAALGRPVLLAALALIAVVGLSVPAHAAEDVLVVELVRTDAYPRVSVRFSISPVAGIAPTDLQPRHITVTEADKRQRSVDVITVRRTADGRSGTYEAVWVSQAIDHPADFVPGMLTVKLSNQPESNSTFTYLKPLLARGDTPPRAPTPGPLLSQMTLRAVPVPAVAFPDVPGLSGAAGVIAGTAILALAAAAGWRAYRREGQERLSLWVTVTPPLRGRSTDGTRMRPKRRLNIPPVMVNWFARVGGRLVTPGQAEKLRRNLVLAGRPGAREFAEFIAIKCLLAVGFAVLGFVTMSGRAGLLNLLLISGCLGVGGFVVPNLWLGRAIKTRQYALRKALPDALDLMTVGVTAGLAFDGAINEIVEKWDNALSHEFAVMLGELRMGTSRREALLNLSERTDVEEIRTVVTQLIQADELGMSLSDTLQTLAGQMRLRRRQHGEEQAPKAAVKMLIPLVFLVFPALFVVIIGPAVPDLMKYVSSAGGS